MDGSTPDPGDAILQGPEVERCAPHGLPGLVREIARTSPDTIALVDDERSLTYAQMEVASDAIARLLAEAGGRPGDIAAVCIPRGCDLVLGLLGALKAGMPYLPLDPEDPRERRAALLRRAKARFVLVTGETAGTVEAIADSMGTAPDGTAATADGAPCVLRVDIPATDPRGAAVGPERWAPLPAVDRDDPAYVLFTSGSTGEPKGVVVPSLALCNRLLWMRDAYGFSPDDRILQKTPATFDVSGWELFGPLISGATEVLIAPGAHRDPGEVVDCIRRHRITVIHFVPSMLEEFLRWPGADRCASLRTVICSGEALTPGLVRRFRSVLGADLHNLYGPTEAAIDVTAWPCPPIRPGDEPDRVLIGNPIDNCTLVVVDDRMRPVAEGDTGQLAIGGLPLALGYLHRPDLTAAAFVPSPDWCPVPRLYLTGDLVRRHKGGLEYLGRRDSQVKIRGRRVEPREAEDALRDHAAVQDAAVVAADGPDGALTLCAFVVPAARSGQSATTDEELRRSLKERLTALLPEALVPSAFVLTDTIPLTGSGKQDQRQLITQARRHLAAADTPGPETEAAPDDALSACWAEALGTLPQDESTGFLEAGGHSLAAARLAGRILGGWGVRLPLSLFLRDNVCLADLRSRLPADALPARGRSRARRPAADAGIPLSPEQRRLWLWQQVHAESSAYNVVGLLRIAGDIDPGALHAACVDLTARHEVLRTVYEQAPSGEPRQRVTAEAEPWWLEERSPRPDPSPAEVEAFASRVCTRVFTPDRLPRLAAGVLHGSGTGSGKASYLVLSVDHLASDQHTLDILQQDLADLYAARVEQHPRALPEPVQYRDALASAERDEAADRQADVEFWRTWLYGVPHHLDLPGRRPRTDLADHIGEAVTSTVDRRTARALDALCRKERVTVASLALSAYARVLSAWSGQRSVLVGLPMSGRRTQEEHEAAGFFVRTVPVRIDVPGEAGTRDLLRPVADAVLTAADHLTPDFDEIADAVGARRSPHSHPLFQVWFNDLTQAAPPARFGPHAARAQTPPSTWSLFDLGFYLSRDPDGGYELRLAYPTALWDRDTVRDFLDACRQALLSVLDTPGETSAGPAEPEPAPAAVRPDSSRAGDTCTALVRAVLDQAARRPDRTALVFGTEAVDYATLALRLRRISALVRERTAPGRTVAVLARRHPELAVALLGCWHAGRPVLLLDAAAPAVWTHSAVTAARADLVITTGEKDGDPTTPVTTPPGVDVLSAAEAALAECAPDPQPEEFTPDAPGHILATSGTSGEPALVVLPANALPEAMHWYAHQLQLGPDDVFCLTTPPAHDPVFRACVLPLVLGARVHIPLPGQTERTEEHLRLLADAAATVVHTTPSQAALLAAAAGDRRLSAPRAVVFHGESLHDTQAAAARALAPGAAVFNLYGTTETPQASSLHRWSPPDAQGGDRAAVPIGRGTAYRSIEVRGPGGRPALVGEVGELVVTGRGLALEYLGDAHSPRRPDVAEPTATGTSGAEVRSHATGDLARRDRHGEITVVGRADRQVSLGGYRVELDGVEAEIARLPGVRRCAVAVDPAAPGILLAWVSGPEVGPDDELSTLLARRVPQWQLPARWIRVDSIPLTRHGKVDAEALMRQPQGRPAGSDRPAAPPQIEALVDLIVRRARAQAPDGDRVGADTGFFDAGLTSLMLLRLFGRLTADDGLRLALADLFRFPTPRELAAHLAAGGGPVPTASPTRRAPAAGAAGAVARERTARRAARRTLGNHRTAQDPYETVRERKTQP
ncbi:amino acid adenylation domain-containing protein [Streptomyces sp. ISL-10]|uniref:non-ribosomal peptide synthetase n=1 Tax=Streptomyces sp. ISL-10 TaxID=2819172 RepID=UPI001BEB5D69|nr:non-ribosomal peptide synthetase [Streptomyces sp. ISL-10]MBT2365568.1 amino acid adenylation domain-containing protein [Streptomyces sp. ISL-10]